jgi:hypothetical protein
VNDNVRRQLERVAASRGVPLACYLGTIEGVMLRFQLEVAAAMKPAAVYLNSVAARLSRTRR